MVEESFRIKIFSSEEIDNAKKKIEEAKRIKREEQDLRRRGGIFAAGTEEGESRRTLPRRQQSAKVKPTSKDRTSKQAFTRGNEFKKLQDKVNAQQKNLTDITKKTKEWEEKFFDKIDTATSFASGLDNLPGTISNALGRFGPIGAIIASALGPALAEFFRQFERGGIFSTKLKVTKDTLTINEIEETAEVRSGTKYITSDLRVVQGAPGTSNTQNLKFEHIRYTSDDVGRP